MENKKIFISDLDNKLGDLDKLLKNAILVKEMEDSTDVLVVSSGMGSLFDISRAVELGKNLYLYDGDGYFSNLKRNLSVGHLITNINQLTENDEINQMMNGDEKENDKSNDGKSSKLL